MNRNIPWYCNTRNNVHHATEARFLTSQIWMNDLEDDIHRNGVEIIELDSMDVSRSSNEDPRENTHQMTSHQWSYAARVKQLEDKYKANRQARLKRRLRNRNRFHETGAFDGEFDDSFYFSNTDCATPNTADVETFKQTCSTILDKLSALELGSSSDDFDESGNEATRCSEVMLESAWNGEAACGEDVIISSGLDGEKRTVWIYSYKNRHSLSDNDYELVNIPSQESVFCNPFEIDDELNTSKTTNRVASPIPSTHIPRLNLSLSATLPNVTEVTEPKSSDCLIQKHVPITQMPANNWCLDNSEKLTENKATSIVNWMALSPRERRWNSRHSSNVAIPLLPVPEVSQDEEKPQAQEPVEFETQITRAAILKTLDDQNRSHFDIKTKTTEDAATPKPPSRVNSHRTSNDSRREYIGDNATYLISPRYKVNETEWTRLKGAIRSAMCDRGDYKVQRPHITIAKPLLQSPITIPIENLDSNDWIAEREQKSCRRHQRALSAGAKLMVRNPALLKPSDWKEYSPITGRRLSIHLDPELETNKTLLQRCISCFKCCKYRFN